MDKRKERSLRATAFHEAGHAVATLHFNKRVKTVTIIPDDTGALGYCKNVVHKWLAAEADAGTRDSGVMTPRARLALEQDVVIFCAGVEGERLFTGRMNHKFAGTDYHNAVDLSSLLCLVPASGMELNEESWIWDLQQKRARALVEYYRNVIEAVADQLMVKKTLGGAQVTEIFRKAYRADMERRYEEWGKKEK